MLILSVCCLYPRLVSFCQICENALERTLAAARTYKRRVEAQMCGYGDLLDGFNFSTERKRILNHKFEPSFDDNVKQVRGWSV